MSPCDDTALSIQAASAEVPGRTALILANEGGRAACYSELAERVRAECPSGSPEERPSSLVATSEPSTVVRILARVEKRVPLALLHPRWTQSETAAVREQLAAHDAAADPLEGCLAIAYTSGTSGGPRGVVLGRDAILAAARASQANLGWEESDRWLLCLPLAHVGGLSVLLRCLMARKTVVLAPRFDASQLPLWIERNRVTLASLVPTMLGRLLDEHPRWRPPAHLRAVLLGGDRAPAALLERAADRGVPVLSTYGLTETCSQVATQPRGTRPSPKWGGGVPLDGVEVRIVDGRIRVRGPMLMTAYYPRAAHPSRFLEGGWFETGDSGWIDERGRLHVLGRWDDRIVTGGETVHPGEVERVLEAHPAVREARVFGLPDERWGQLVAAALVPVDQVPSDGDLRAYVEENLAPFRRPRRIAFVTEIPRLPSGKLDRSPEALGRLQLRPLFPVGF